MRAVERKQVKRGRAHIKKTVVEAVTALAEKLPTDGKAVV
jgi:hypothetical protein